MTRAPMNDEHGIPGPVAPPVPARRAALRVDMTVAPPIRHGKARRHPRISGRSIAYLFLPHFVLAVIITAAALALKGALA